VVAKTTAPPDGHGRCPVCNRAFPLLSGKGRRIPRHTYQRVRTCAGSLKQAAAGATP